MGFIRNLLGKKEDYVVVNPPYITNVRDYKNVVDAASLYLDELHPEWFLKIDLDNFSILSISKCIVGQLFVSKCPTDMFSVFISIIPSGTRGAFGEDQLYNHNILRSVWKETIQQRIEIYHKEKERKHSSMEPEEILV